MLNNAQVFGVSGGVTASAAMIAVLLILRSSKFSRNIQIASSIGAVVMGALVFTLSSFGVLKWRCAATVDDLCFASRLQFVHITKTGGTSIEDAGLKQHIKWGRFWAYPKCCRWKRLPSSSSHWHVPPKYFRNNPYEQVDTFTVVRNPYTRCLSEFNCNFTGFKGTPTVQNLNRWIQKKLNGPNRCSFRPCAEYVFDDDGNKIITHIIRFENLRQEFAQLMALYNLDVKLSVKNKGRTNHLTIDKFNKDTIALINDYFQMDFDKFGYERKELD